MKIGDRVRQNVKDPRTMVHKKSGETVEVYGIVESVGVENEWHIDWDDGRRTDENEVYATKYRKGEPCLLIV